MVETKNIETVISKFYDNIKNFFIQNKDVYSPLSSESRRNEDYFQFEMKSPWAPLGTKDIYVRSKFEEIVKMYYSSGLEELSKNSDNYITTKISNNIWRRRINIKTPERELEIRAYRPFWKWFEIILPFPIIPFLKHRFKLRFKRVR